MLKDPSGQPIANISIVASSLIYLVGRGQLSTVATATTDDRGVYRIRSLPPVDYIVSATYRAPLGAISALNESYASQTYFPGSTAFDRAARVAVEKDKETAGIDFSIGKSDHVNIFGKIVREGSSALLRPSASPTIYIVPHTDDGMDFTADLQSVPLPDPELSFVLRHVEPGPTDLIAVLRDQNDMYVGRIMIDTRLDVRDVVLPVSRGAAMTGVVVSEVKDVENVGSISGRGYSGNPMSE